MLVLQFLVNGIMIGSAYALIALGFGLIYNTTRIFNFAYGAVYTLAAYLFYTFHISLEWNVWLAALLSIVSATVAGILIDEVIFSPLIERSSSTFITLLSSLGLYIVIINILALFYGAEIKTLSPGLQPTYSIGAILLTRIQIITLISSAILFTTLFITLRRTILGKVIRAMRDDPDLLLAMGIDQRLVRRTVFALGSALSAVAAILLGLDVGIDLNVGMAAILSAAVAVIIGGVGVFEGAAVGGLLLGILQSLVIWQTSAKWADAITFTFLIFFLLFRPEGLLGRRRRIEEASV
jgi:branched-chain amino acid transport system permease protein